MMRLSVIADARRHWALGFRDLILAIVIVVWVLLACATARAQTASISATVTDESGRALEDAVIVAVPADGRISLPPRPRDELIDQVDKEFVPRVKAVVVGTAIRFPNRDNVRHHVYSFSGAKRFELPLYSGVPAQAVTFDRAGVVVLGCNIHDWMVGYVYVSESPYFGRTDRSGKATLTGLPAQTYIVRVWHPQQEGSEEATRRSIDLLHAPQSEMAWSVKVKPEVRVRRAPVPGHGSHY